MNAIGVTLATPGTRRSAGATTAGIPASLFALRVLDDQVAREGAVDGLVDRRLRAGGEYRDEATSARPTVSAIAVTSVRPGWRIAFSARVGR